MFMLSNECSELRSQSQNSYHERHKVTRRETTKRSPSRYAQQLTAMIPARLWTRNGCEIGRGANRPLQHGQKLLDSGVFLLGQFSLAPKQPRIQFSRKQCILKTLHHPVDDRNDHLDVHVLAQFAAIEPEAHEGDGSVGIFADEEAVNLALQNKIGAV